MVLFTPCESKIDYRSIETHKIFNSVENSCRRFVGNKDFRIDHNTIKCNPIGDFHTIVKFVLTIVLLAGQNPDPKLVGDVCDELEYTIYHRHMNLSRFCAMVLVARYTKRL